MLELKELYKGIGFPKTAEKTAEILFHDQKLYQELNEKWTEDREDFYKWMKKCGEDTTLSFYVLKVLEVYEEYEKRGIDRKIFFDTFRDITIWCTDYYKKHGRFGLKEAKWLALSADLKLFRFGRLQFEPYRINKAIHTDKNDIPEGEAVLNVHIPEGGPMTLPCCQDSFCQAATFFGKSYRYAACCSWLLSPALIGLLPETSNIIRFQKLFDIYDIKYPFRQAEERVFGFISDDIEVYPERTSLQRALKKAVREGLDIGMGCGVQSLKNWI